MGPADQEAEPGAHDNGLVGLEVTAVGNVSELLSGEAMRIDRDGLGTSEDDQGEVGIPDGESEYDYDYFDYDDLTEYDDDYGEDLTEEGVLVVSASGLQDWAVDEAVRVSGTVRRFDQEAIESLYEIDLEDDVFDPEENSLVIVADSVQAVTAPAASGGSGGGTGGGSSTG